MPKMGLSHFETTLLFALFSSVVLGIVSKRTDRERLRYGLTSFAWFMGTVFGLAWIMWIAHR